MTSGTMLTYEMLRQADEGKMENWTLNRGSLWVSASALLLVTWGPSLSLGLIPPLRSDMVPLDDLSSAPEN